jgi:acetyl-CoA carboxylase carboxyltransferase component
MSYGPGMQSEEFRAERERIRRDMGGAAKVARLRAAGKRTARDHIDQLVDPGTFREIGTFARSERPEDRDATPADGKICGHATIDGRPVTLAVDDVTVKRATSSLVGARKLQRTYEQAVRGGNPFVYLGETGGARLPDTLGAVGYSNEPVFPWLARRRREIPVATAIVGESFGGSSFVAGLSDFVVQVRGSTLAITSPRVIQVATGEQVTNEGLGGAAVHETRTGQIDVAVDTDDEAHEAIRHFLSFLPSRAGDELPRRPRAASIGPDPALAALVPERRSQTYDVREVIARLIDDGDLLELKPAFGAGLVTALGRIDGCPVGIVASQPASLVGSLTPDACGKATRLVCLCDAFGLPIVFLQDTPGFLVGTTVEHDRLLARAMLFLEALCLTRVPKLTVVLRKAFGLAFFSMGGSGMGSDLLVAWPGAEIGFMDPIVGASVLHGDELAGLAGDERRAELDRLARELGSDTDPMAIAAAMNIDEVIDPADTRAVLADALTRYAARLPARPSDLAAWPHWW